MKMKLYPVIGLTALTFLISCSGEDNKDYVDKSIMPTPEEKAAYEKAAAEKAALKNVSAGQNTVPAPVLPAQTTMPVTMTQTQQPQTMTVNPQTVTQNMVPTVTQPGMNPPHGQPGHRCDIAVGAPLNSKPATTQASTVSTAAQPGVTIKEIPNKTKTPPGMNPPHGEPGHRCDIAVGAPLDSKPANPAATPAATQPAQITPPALITAPKPDSNNNK